MVQASFCTSPKLQHGERTATTRHGQPAIPDLAQLQFTGVQECTHMGLVRHTNSCQSLMSFEVFCITEFAYSCIESALYSIIYPRHASRGQAYRPLIYGQSPRIIHTDSPITGESVSWNTHVPCGPWWLNQLFFVSFIARLTRGAARSRMEFHGLTRPW